MPTTLTTYTPEQLAAAYRLHDTCHELLAVTADEPARSSAADFEEIWRAWHDAYGRAYRVHEDAEHDYRHSFGHAETIPEAHEVIAVATATRVELLRAHLPIDWEYLQGDEMRVWCLCGAQTGADIPEELTDMDSVMWWVHAQHVAKELPR